MIIVTGATGQLGHQIVQNLAKRVPASEIGASARDIEKAAGLSALGIRVRPGNFDDPQSLQHSFEGATQVLIVSSNARATGGDSLAQHANAIAAAKAVGAKRIVYTSHMAVSHTSAFPPMLDHATTEVMLRDCGLAWTALRHGFYASSGLGMLGDGLQTGVFEAPTDGKVSWTAHADLAEAAAVILANDGQFEGPTPPLTGSQSISFEDLASIASKTLNKPVVRKTLTDEEFRAKLAARGAPAAVAHIAMGFFVASRNGEFSANNSTLEKLIGHPPIAMAQLIAQKMNAKSQ